MNLFIMLQAHLVSNGRAAPTDLGLIIDESYASSIISPTVIGFANNKDGNISHLLSEHQCSPDALAYALDVIQPLLSLGWKAESFDGNSFRLTFDGHCPLPALRIWLPIYGRASTYLGLPADDQPMTSRLIELILRWRKAGEITISLDRRDSRGFLEWQLAVRRSDSDDRPFVMGMIQRKAGDRVEVHS